MRIAFMGTPDFAVPALQALIEAGHDIACVYSQPPRPKGRGQQVQKSPVHVLAETHNIPVRNPRSLKKDEAAQKEFADLKLDAAVVAAYGLILPKTVLDAPKHGCLNIHASLLPRWRGASPIQHAIWKGDRMSGVCIMQMEEGLDTGPVLARGEAPIDAETTAQMLHDRLGTLGAALIADVLSRLQNGEKIPAEKQDDAQATYAPLLSKDDGRINWQDSAADIGRQVRALNPWPGVWTMTPDGRRLKVLEVHTASEEGGAPGTLSGRTGHVSCGHGALVLSRVQPENAKPMDAASAINGGHLKPGDVLK